MKVYFSFILLALSLVSQAQNSIVGKWKPIYFSMGSEVTGDLSRTEPEIKISLDSLVMNDKDPEASKKMMKMMFQLIFDKTKALIEEYLPSGEYKETDFKSGRTKSGIYIIDNKKGELVKTYTNSTKKFNYTVQWSLDKLVLISTLQSAGEKNAELRVTYEKL